MLRKAWAGAHALLLLAGCAPTMATLPATATAADRQRADMCHATALGAVERDPGVFAAWAGEISRKPWWSTALEVLNPEKLAVGLVVLPILLPIAKTKYDGRVYTAAFDRCMIFGPAALATDGDPVCFQALVSEGPAFCPRDIVSFTLPEPGWMVGRSARLVAVVTAPPGPPPPPAVQAESATEEEL